MIDKKAASATYTENIDKEVPVLNPRRRPKKLKGRFIFVMLVAAAIIFSTMFRLLTPPRQEAPVSEFVVTNFDNTQTVFNGFTWQGGGEPTYPEQLAIATARQTSKTTPQIINNLVNTYNLEVVPNQDQTWTSPTKYLSYDPVNQRYILGTYQTDLATITFQESEIIFASQKILNETLEALSVRPVISEIFTAKVDTHVEEVSSSQAQIAQVPFNYYINDIAVYFRKSIAPPFEVTLDSNYQLHKLTFQPFFYDFTIVQNLDRISLEQAILNINNNEASVLAASQDELGPLDVTKLSDGRLHTVNLEYRFDDTSQAVVPYYHFVGDATNQQNKRLTLEILTPAVEINLR